MRRVLAMAVLLAGSAPLLAEQVYRWVDEAGVVHFSATPPPGQKTEVEDLRFQRTPDPAAAEAAQQRWQKEADDARTAEDKAAADAAAAGKQAAERRRNCNTAREIVARLQTAPGTSFRREDGSYQRYSAEEIEKKIAEARAREREYCD